MLSGLAKTRLAALPRVVFFKANFKLCMTSIQARFTTTGLKLAVVSAILGVTYWYGGHSTRAEWRAEKQAHAAVIEQVKKQHELTAENERLTYETSIKNITEQNLRSVAAGNRLIARLRNEQGNCTKDSSPQGADGKTKLPRINW
jgi:flagellar biosynthesis component FlhA